MIKYRIRQLRKEKGWSQKHAADAVGLSLDMIKSIEQGRANPSMPTALRMKAAFGCHYIDDLIDSAM